MQSRKINWDDEPLTAFKAALAYIRKKSPQNADKVKEEILERIDKLSQHPEMYPPDKWKEDNERQFRAFELHRFRISYLVKEEEVVIVRFRHTSQQPEMY